MKLNQVIKNKCPLCGGKMQHSLHLLFRKKQVTRSINKNILSMRLLDFRETFSLEIYGELMNVLLDSSCNVSHAYEKRGLIEIKYNFGLLLSDLDYEVENETAVFELANSKGITIYNDFLRKETICQYALFKKMMFNFPYRVSSDTPDKIEKLLLLQ